MSYVLDELRRQYHENLRAEILTVAEDDTPSIADGDSAESVEVALHLVQSIGAVKVARRLPGQTSGRKFEEITHTFLRNALPSLNRLRPGRWEVRRVQTRDGTREISRFSQFAHLRALEKAAAENDELAVALGTDYVIAPDIVVFREPLSDEELNGSEQLVGPATARLSSLRGASNMSPILHASISCKWTIRSDRSQNSRSEAQNLIRNRKGRAPQVAVVTAEPLPKRLSSIALGTGDLDCVYHAALAELREAVEAKGSDESKRLLKMMITGKRLADIADLPLDLIA